MGVDGAGMSARPAYRPPGSPGCSTRQDSERGPGCERSRVGEPLFFRCLDASGNTWEWERLVGMVWTFIERVAHMQYALFFDLRAALPTAGRYLNSKFRQGFTSSGG